MGLFYKKIFTKEDVSCEKVNCVDSQSNNLDAKKDFPYGWITYSRRYIDMIEDDLWPFRNAILNAETDMAMYVALKSFLLYLHDAEVHYKEMGEFVWKYFE